MKKKQKVIILMAAFFVMFSGWICFASYSQSEHYNDPYFLEESPIYSCQYLLDDDTLLSYGMYGQRGSRKSYYRLSVTDMRTGEIVAGNLYESALIDPAPHLRVKVMKDGLFSLLYGEDFIGVFDKNLNEVKRIPLPNVPRIIDYGISDDFTKLFVTVGGHEDGEKSVARVYDNLTGEMLWQSALSDHSFAYGLFWGDKYAVISIWAPSPPNSGTAPSQRFIAVFNIETGEEEYRLSRGDASFPDLISPQVYSYTRMGDLLLLSPNIEGQTSDRYVLGEIIDDQAVFTEHILPFEAEILTSEIISEYMVAEIPTDEKNAQYVVLGRAGNIIKQDLTEKRVFLFYSFLNTDLQISESGHVLNGAALLYAPYEYPVHAPVRQPSHILPQPVYYKGKTVSVKHPSLN